MQKYIVNLSCVINKSLIKWLMFVLFLLGKQSMFPQEKGFLSIIRDEGGMSMEPIDVVETASGGYLIIANDYHNTKSKIIQLDVDGFVETETDIVLADTLLRLANVFSVESDNLQDSCFVVIGTCRPVTGGIPAIITFVVGDDIGIRRRKVEPLLFAEQDPIAVSVMPYQGGFVSGLSFLAFGIESFLVRISSVGTITKWQKCDVDSLGLLSNLFAVHGAPDRIGMFAQTSISSDAMAGVLVFDSSFNLERRAYFGPLESLCENGNLIYSYLFPRQSMMIPLPYNNYVISSKLRENEIKPNGVCEQQDESVLFVKTDADFNLQNDGVIVEHFNDTVEIPAPFRSIVSTKDGYVFQCSIGNVNYPSAQFRRDLHLILTKTDEDLNVVWKKRFLRDGNAYFAFSIASSSDGGCIVVGTMFDFNAEQRLDAFALKIDADGTVGVKEIQEGSMASVYPNPAKETIRMVGVKAKETKVYNVLGQHVMSFGGNEADVKALAAGIYLLRVIEANGNVQMLRAVVTK